MSIDNTLEEKVYIGLGSNIEPRLEYLYKAVFTINQIEGCQLNSISSVYESAAMGFDGPTFYNMVIQVSCSLSPKCLLEACQKIERQLGRIQKSQRNEIYQSRQIDLDILQFGNKKIKQKELMLPHPEINNRAFVKIPLEEIKNRLTSTTSLLQETRGSHSLNPTVTISIEATNELKRLLNRAIPQ